MAVTCTLYEDTPYENESYAILTFEGKWTAEEFLQESERFYTILDRLPLGQRVALIVNHTTPYMPTDYLELMEGSVDTRHPAFGLNIVVGQFLPAEAFDQYAAQTVIDFPSTFARDVDEAYEILELWWRGEDITPFQDINRLQV